MKFMGWVVKISVHDTTFLESTRILEEHVHKEKNKEKNIKKQKLFLLKPKQDSSLNIRR